MEGGGGGAETEASVSSDIIGMQSIARPTAPTLITAQQCEEEIHDHLATFTATFIIYCFAFAECTILTESKARTSNHICVQCVAWHGTKTEATLQIERMFIV